MDELLGLQLGAADYLIKPIRPSVLLVKIEAARRIRQIIHMRTGQKKLG